MRSWITRRTLGALLACAVLGAGALPAHADIVIGQVAPLSGVLASTGQQMVLGGKLYFDSVNAKGGVNGQKLRVVVVDDAYKVDETVKLTREMTSHPEVV